MRKNPISLTLQMTYVHMYVRDVSGVMLKQEESQSTRPHLHLSGPAPSVCTSVQHDSHSTICSLTDPGGCQLLVCAGTSEWSRGTTASPFMCGKQWVLFDFITCCLKWRHFFSSLFSSPKSAHVTSCRMASCTRDFSALALGPMRSQSSVDLAGRDFIT